MHTSRSRDLRATAFLLVAGLLSLAPAAQGQFAGLLQTNSRYAGNSTGTAGFSGDTGTATATSLSLPSYAVFDSTGNLYVSDTANNCVRKLDTSGNITTVAGLRVSGGPDTCNTATNSNPTVAQGLLAPTGLAIDSANTLYIADSLHNCVRSLASGAVDSFAANALTTVAGTCSAVDTASVTPVPNGLAVDGSLNLYISIQDTGGAPQVNQVVRHLKADPATTVCYLAGQPSANVSSACAGLGSTVTLANPAALAFDLNGNLFVADTGNSCVREIAGLTTQQTAVGQCLSDSSGNSATALHSPYGLAFSPTGTLYISEIAPLNNNVLSFSPGAGTLTTVAGLPSGTAGPYSAALDGQSSLSAPLNLPRGLTTDASGNVYLADSLNSVIRKMSTGRIFAAQTVGVVSGSQLVTFGINQAVNLSATTGPDYSMVSNTCSGVLAPPVNCQVAVRFTPSLPGQRSSALQLKDSLSGKIVSVALAGTGNGPLSLFTPGTVNTIAGSLRNPLAVAADSAGNAYILEQGNGTTTADVLRVPVGGGATQITVPQGAGMATPTAMAVDGAGNVFVTDASLKTVERFGADGSVNLSYATGLVSPTAIAVDTFGNLYVAQSGAAHNVIEIYAGGTVRVVAGSGATANANGVAATSALFLSPSALVLGPNGSLSIADSGGHVVYTVNNAGTIAIVAGTGTTSTTTPGQALGTGLLTPVALAADAAGDLYISDQASNRVYEVYPVQSSGSNIATVLGSGVGGYTGDGGSGPKATVQGPLGMALDSAGDVFVVDGGNSALREVTHPLPPTVNFNDVIIGTTSPATLQIVSNAGNAAMLVTTPFTTSDTHFASTSTTCGSTLVSGGLCTISYTFSPTTLGPLSATSSLVSNSSNSPQTIQLTGYGFFSQALPYTLSPQTEVYGQPFTETVTMNLVFPDLVPTGTITYSIGGKTLCSTTGSFPGVVNCTAAASGLGIGTYTVTFTYTSGDVSYFSTTGTTSLAITAPALTVTPVNVSKAYGAAIPVLPVTITGVANGDTFLSTVATTATSASPPGTYPITATLTGVGLSSLNNYVVTYNTGTLTVTPAPLGVLVANATRQYGQANPAFSSTVTGAANGDILTVTYSTTATPTSPVGTYPITATITGANIAFYTVSYTAGTLTVTQAPLTVTVASASRAYGVANPVFTATIAGALNGDTFTSSLSTTATIASSVGNYPVSDALSGAAAGNYSITIVPGTLTITPTTTALVVAVNGASRLYGAANPAFTSTVTGALNGDTFTLTYATAATPTSPVGTYAILPTVSGAALANYASVTTVNGTLTVTQAPLTVTVANAARVYATANPAFTASVAGALNSDTFSGALSTTATIASSVGSYPISDVVTGAAAANYAITVVPGTLTITQATAPLTFAANNSSRTYGAVNPAFTGTVTGALNGDTFTLTYATTATAASPVGTYPITPTVSGVALANYAVVVKTNGTLTVTAAPLTVAVVSVSRAYGAANPVFTSAVTGALNGDTFTNTFATTVTAASPVGVYPITDTVSGAAASNYTIAVIPGTLTVTPATLTVAANSGTRVYGAANPASTGTIVGLVNGDTASATYGTAATIASPVGSYPIVPSVTGSALGNYTLVVSNGALAITPAPLTVTVANASRAYGVANPAFTATIAGALNGDAFTNTFSTTATIASPVGTYPIADALGGTAASNYTVVVVPGTLTVTKATVALTVTANNASRVYGAANPVFTSAIAGALNGDTFTTTYATTATVASPIGTYPIVPTVSGTALGNYTLVTVNGTLTVTPATLTVVANNATRVYGAANPTFTATIAGLVNGDTVTVTYSTTASPASPIGTYPIVPAVSGAALANYTLVTSNGTLTVTPATAPLTVTVGNATRAYGAVNPTVTSTITGLLSGDTVTVTYSTTATVASAPGSYPITATVSGAAAANYTITIVPGALTVTQAATATTLASSANPVNVGTPITFTTTVTSVAGVPTGTVNFFLGQTQIGSATLVSGGATLTLSGLPIGSNTVTATYAASTNFAASSGTVIEVVNPGSFVLLLNPPSTYIRGPGTTVYTLTASSTQNFSGAVALTCSGLPADASCSFGSNSLILTANGTATTTVTIVNTAADASLTTQQFRDRQPSDMMPIAAAAVLPFELTGLGVLFAGARRRRTSKRPLLLLLCTLGILCLAGCACFTSVYKTYTVTITGTSSVAGTTPQSATATISVGEQ